MKATDDTNEDGHVLYASTALKLQKDGSVARVDDVITSDDPDPLKLDDIDIEKIVEATEMSRNAAQGFYSDGYLLSNNGMYAGETDGSKNLISYFEDINTEKLLANGECAYDMRYIAIRIEDLNNGRRNRRRFRSSLYYTLIS